MVLLVQFERQVQLCVICITDIMNLDNITKGERVEEKKRGKYQLIKM